MAGGTVSATFETAATLVSGLVGAVVSTVRLAGGLFTARDQRERTLRLVASTSDGVQEPPTVDGRIGSVLLVAGEPSGDVLGADLARALAARDPQTVIAGTGGPRMQAAGVSIIEDLVSDPVMGFLPVLKRLPFFAGLYRRLLLHIDETRPDVVVGIDYPGLNQRLARACRKRGIPFVQYVAPQVWAWAAWRTKRWAEDCARILTILPFEQPIFADAGGRIAFVGHPLFEHLADRVADADYAASLRSGLPDGGAVIAILPGSRRSEVEQNLPLMLKAALMVHGHSPATRFVIAMAREKLRPLVEHAVRDGNVPNLRIADPAHSDDVMAAADAALTVSGTATLHLVAHGTPATVVYRVSTATRVLSSALVVSPFIALPNLLAGRELLPEFLTTGDDTDVQRIANALLGLMPGGPSAESTRAALGELRARLHVTGVAARAAAWVHATASAT